MNTMMWKILVAILIFADGNVVYFEIRRLIQYLHANSNEPKSLKVH